VTFGKAIGCTRDLAKREGIFCGISGGGTFAAALGVDGVLRGRGNGIRRDPGALFTDGPTLGAQPIRQEGAK